MNKLIKAALLTAALILASSCYGDPRAEFDTEYSQYVTYTDSQQWQLALESAEKAYVLGKVIFGEKSINTGNLALNYGRLLNILDLHKEAKPALLAARKILENSSQTERANLIDVYFELGIATYDPEHTRPGLAHFRKAVKLSASENDLARARINLSIGLYVAARLDRQGNAEAFLGSAYLTYLDTVGPTDVRTSLASFQLGRYSLAKRNYKKAKKHLQLSVDAFEENPENRKLELMARAFIIEALEELGESEAATEHCRAIGIKAPLDQTAKYVPLYKKPPIYPAKALRRGQSGWVIVELTVDENGFTRDHQIVESSSTVFNSASITAAETFRYAPRFVNGLAVTTPSVRNKITFSVGRD